MPYADTFDESDPLGKPFLASLALHGGVAALLAGRGGLAAGTRVVVVLSGSNIDHARLKELL